MTGSRACAVSSLPGSVDSYLEDHPPTRTLKLIWDRRRYFTPLVYSLLTHLESLFPALRPLIVQGRV
jgi:hypothetical protein